MNFSRPIAVGLAALAVSVLCGGVVPDAAASERTVIHFADLGGIRDWRAGESDSLLVQGRNGKWFKATFWGGCPEIRFSDTIAFITDRTGDLDKFSSIIASGHRCWFASFAPTEAPSSMK